VGGKDKKKNQASQRQGTTDRILDPFMLFQRLNL